MTNKWKSPTGDAGMRRTISMTILAMFMLPEIAIATFHKKDASDQFLGMEGWAIAAVTHVDGSFHGCKFNQAIAFSNGLVLKCISGDLYGPLLGESHPSAVIFFKTGEHKGKKMYNIRVLIGNKMYNMAPIIGESL